MLLQVLYGKVYGQHSTIRQFNKMYYVDDVNGSDTANGLSEHTAWKTLEPVNSTRFSPGTKILFKAGGIWLGQLKPKGSGETNYPIIIDRYGSGPKPLINANGALGGVITLYNQSFWEINNLEITNDAADMGDRNGVAILAENNGLISHIYLKNLYVHDVKGIISNGARTAGILFKTLADDKRDTRFDDVLIEGCEINNVQNQGIHFRTPGERSAGFNYPGTPDWERRKFTNMVIRNNVIHHISKNAILIRTTEGGLVEHNLCYETALDTTGNTIFTYGVRGTVFQYNEGYLNRSPGADGSLYDADIASPGTIWQYSYSHDNAHGLMWYCTDPRDTGIIVRYNISQNDKGRLIYFNYAFTSSSVYNNVFYVADSLSPTIIAEKITKSHNYRFYNNIIYNNSATAKYALATTGAGVQNRDYSHNIFYGQHPDGEPDDPHKIISDPKFVNPGKGRIGLKTLNGYRLKLGSPAIKAGKVVPHNGSRDFYGNAIPAFSSPNIGVYNGDGIK